MKEDFIIEVDHLMKDFHHWENPPTSIKSLLVDLSRFRRPGLQIRHFRALNDLSFKIKRGEFVGIMGRNGEGKSTLMKILSGIYHPTHGSVRIQGRIAPLIELGAGFHPELSGYENIFLNAAILGVGQKATHATLPDILRFADLGSQITMPVKNYSSGMLVRLGFAVATHLPADIILIDEILSVGDAGFQAKCLEKIHALHRQGSTLVLITHDPHAVSSHCSRCIVLDQHRIVYDGKAAQGASHYLAAVIRTQSESISSPLR